MGYEINQDNIEWARKRVAELTASWVGTGLAAEQLREVPNLLRMVAEEMGSQPEVNRVYSFVNDIEKLSNDLNAEFRAWTRDRRKLAAAIRKYEKGGESDDHDS